MLIEQIIEFELSEPGPLGRTLGWSEKSFFRNSKKCSLEILANGLKIEKNRLFKF